MHTLTHSFATSATPSAVRAALTTADGIRGWWSRDCDVDEDAHELRFDKGGRTVTMNFRVDQAEDHEVRLTCTANGNPVWVGTTLTWRVAEGTVTLEHAGFAEDQSPPFAMTRDGWPMFVASLEAYLATGTGQPM